MSGFPPITVRQPHPQDIVDDPIGISGVGTAFEATFQVRVRDGNGVEIAQDFFMAGGTGIWGNFHTSLALPGLPATAQGTLEVYEISAKNGSEINKVIVPVVFGRKLLDPYHGFAQYTVGAGDTLSKISREWYGDAKHWRRLFDANRHQISDPNLIRPGQILRIPQ